MRTITTRSASNIHVEAADATVARRYWFGMKIGKDWISSIISIPLETMARNQGKSNAVSEERGWFELAILTQSYGRGRQIGINSIKLKNDREILTWAFLKVPPQDKYQSLSRTVFMEDFAEFWKNVTEDDWIAVLACAQLESTCDGSTGRLSINIASGT